MIKNSVKKTLLRDDYAITWPQYDVLFKVPGNDSIVVGYIFGNFVARPPYGFNVTPLRENR